MSLPTELRSGYERFRQGRLSSDRDRYQTLADEGQHPSTMVIACCDSRAAPETIFDTGPGELFVVRNVANLVPPYATDGGQHAAAAAIEYAIAALKVETILVLGHARCGGIAAALDEGFEPLTDADFVGRWIAPVRSEAIANGGDGTAQQTATERRSVQVSIERLRKFPQVAEAERDGRLRLRGAWFDIASGELWSMDPESGDFSPVTGAN